MKLPSFNDLIPEQSDILDCPPDSSILVVGPPGSGKTSIAIWRARLLTGPTLRRSVVLVTRNRLLASAAEKLGQENGGARITSTTMNTFISQDYFYRFRQPIPQWQPFDYKWGQILSEYETAHIQPDLDHLIIDEGQNLPVEFIIWASRFKARAVSVFADENQSTSNIGCRVADLHTAGFTEIYPLTVNHRNTQEIAEVVSHFHVDRTLPQATPKRGRSFEIPYLMSTPDWETLANAITARLENRAEAIGVIVYYKQDVETLAGLLRSRLGNTRVDFYTSDANAGAESVIQMRDYGVTILSGESAIGLEFDTLYLQDLSRSLPTNNPLDSRRLYMLMARARDTLILVNGPNRLTPHQFDWVPDVS